MSPLAHRDKLTTELWRHEQIGSGEGQTWCLCGWSANPDDDQRWQYSAHLADVVRGYRRTLPVSMQAEHECGEDCFRFGCFA